MKNSSIYASALEQFQISEQRINELAQYANSEAANVAQSNIIALNQELDSYLNSKAKNSAGQSAGIIASRVGDCSGNGYYIRAYCPKIHLLKQQINEQKQIISGHNQYISAMEHRNNKQSALENVNYSKDSRI